MYFYYFILTATALLHFPLSVNGQNNILLDSLNHQLELSDQLKSSQPLQAIDLLEDVLQIAEQKGLKSQEARANQQLSRLYAEKGDFVMAIDKGLKALRFYTDLDDNWQICQCYIILGVIYRYQHQYQQSLEYYQVAEKLADVNNFDTIKSAIWGNMGNIYYDMQQYDKALSYHLKSLEVDQQLNNLQGMGNTYHNIGMIHLSQRDFTKAIDYYERSLKIDEDMGNQRNLIISYIDFTHLYMEIQNYQKALTYANQALDLANEIEFTKFYVQAMGFLPVIHAALGNYQEANTYYKKFRDMSDSLQSESLSKQIAEMQIKYETEQKEQELALRESSITQQRILIFTLVGFLILVSLLGYLYFSRYKLKQKNKQLQMENEQFNLSHHLKEREEVDETINYFATSLFGKNTLDEILWDVAKNCINRLGLVDCVIYLVDDSRNVLVQKAAYGDKNPEGFVIHQPIEIPIGKGIVGSVALTGLPEIVNNTQADPRYIVDDDARFSEIAVPLVQHDKVIGVIDSEHPEKDFFRKYHLEALKTIAAICTSKISQTLANEEAEKAKQAQIEAEHIKKLDLMKSQFFANISHEFRTPLNLILAPLQNHKEAILTNDIEMMRRNAERLLRLVNQLLDLAKIEVGLMKAENRNVEIFRFVKSIADSFIHFAETKEITYQIIIPERDFIVFIDPDKLEKIVYNLLSNAFKFTPKGGAVGITLSVQQDFLRFDVFDTGIGIPDHLKEKIFNRFYQIDASQTRKYEGSGIGLSLTKELVDLLGGTIGVDTHDGKGCVFTVSLPVFVSENRDLIEDETIADPYYSFLNTASEISHDQAEPAEFSEDLPLVLFVEDNNDLRVYLKTRLSSEFNIVEACNGSEGLKLAQQKIPDLIITDIMMPEMDGVILTKNLRESELTNHIPIILLTARDDGETKIKGFETGAEQYLVKPFAIDELTARINSLLNQRNRLRQKFSRQITLEPEKITIQDKDAVFLEKIMEIIKENMTNEGFTVEQLQKEIGMSRMQLHRKLKALTNQSASEFVRTVKLKSAAQILSQPGVQVAEAAYLSGFSHLSYFAKCFKEQYGVAPSVYAENAANDLIK